jgi:hypothetical protein
METEREVSMAIKNNVGGRTLKEDSTLATRIPWMIFAPFEFAVTVLVGIVLYVAGALYFAACVFLAALRGLFNRASVLFVQRFRKGRIFSSGGKTGALSLSEIVARRAGDARTRSHSWLN